MTTLSKSLVFCGAVLLVTGVLAASADQSAAATRVCGERDKLTKFLAKKYKENPKAVGVSSSGKAVLEVFTSSEGSWTVTMTAASGVTCIMGAGHSWQDSDPIKYLPKS